MLPLDSLIHPKTSVGFDSVLGKRQDPLQLLELIAMQDMCRPLTWQVGLDAVTHSCGGMCITTEAVERC